ncbi:hypothetical protein RFI_15726 [Reticulomyxa filosa]|uniref:Uncharacterized protein n=1 Tax=Reticulomyxa filosa TaxID=46433 RepID=X6N852_RETFI|nr:hypothetical protein RFI_15726 [Reticulomyxa filosa]|eukprot:ETO21477.1 hypothetical protein RFI_15726 [Reticulomyxa filosa]
MTTPTKEKKKKEEKEKEKVKARMKKSCWKYYELRFWFLTGVSLLGEFVLFIGLFNTCDIVYQHTMNFLSLQMKSGLWFVLAIMLMCNKYVNTFWSIACVFPPWHQSRRCEHHESCRKHLEMSFLSVLSLLAMNMVAVIIQNNLQTAMPATHTLHNISKPLFLCSSGLLIYISTGSFIGNSFIWLDESHSKKSEGLNSYNDEYLPFSSLFAIETSQTTYSWKSQLVYFVRALLAFFAQVEHQFGAWEIFDNYITAPTVSRDLIYVVIGLFGLHWSKALLMNACITPFHVPVQPDGIGAIYSMSEQNILSMHTPRQEKEISTFNTEMDHPSSSLPRRRHVTTVARDYNAEDDEGQEEEEEEKPVDKDENEREEEEEEENNELNDYDEQRLDDDNEKQKQESKGTKEGETIRQGWFEQ